MKIVALGQALIHQPVAWPPTLRHLVQDADAVFCNLEGCLPPDGCWPMKSRTVHAAHPEALAMLRDLGVTHLSIANNHVWDYGHAGIVETRRRAELAGFAVAGAGRNLQEALAPAIRGNVALIAVDAGPTPDWAIASDSPGIAPLRMRHSIGLPSDDIQRLKSIAAETGERMRRTNRANVGYDASFEAENFYGLSLRPSDDAVDFYTAEEPDMSQLKSAIQIARTHAETVLVSIHYHNWAPDWAQPPDWLRDASLTVAEAGADAILCTGPPFAYHIEHIGKKPFAPSLGNLVFHTARGPVYDKLQLPVWQGKALIKADGSWRETDVDVLKPATG
jgi:poly-gamma-glutamate capsule biosynthesis protein CapA/YwtB (metallophosphatase superfamily)